MSIHEEKSQNSLYMLLGVFFTGVALVSLVSLVVIRTKAAGNVTATQDASINNEPPTYVTTPIISYTQNSDVPVANNEIQLVEGTSQTIWVNGEIQDVNGYADMNGGYVKVSLYNSATLTGAGCQANPDDTDSCYSVTALYADLTCNQGPNAATNCTYSIPVSLTNHTDPSTFKAYLSMRDGNDTAAVTTESGTATVLTLSAINVEAGVNYGGLVVGAMGKDLLTVDNWGNITVDVKARSTDFLCTVGVIPATLVSFNGTGLNTADTTITSYDLVKQTGATAGLSTTNTYMELGPVNNVQGSCTATLNMTAIPNN